jgi:hypothetical protein
VIFSCQGSEVESEIGRALTEARLHSGGSE